MTATTKPKIAQLPLGTRVQFRHALDRRESGMQGRRHVRRWLPSVFAKPDDPMQTGVIVGYRTKYDGYTEYGSFDEPNHFVPVGARRLAMVATHVNLEPSFVDPADLVVLPTGLNALAARVHEANMKWWIDIHDGVTPLKRNKGELLALIHSEISEALEGERKDLMDDKLPHRKMAEVEITDAIIRILDYAAGFGYDIEGAFEEKMAFNAQREDHKHEARRIAGGKQF